MPTFNFIPVFLLLISYFVFDKEITQYQLFAFSIIFIWGLVLSIQKDSFDKFKLNKWIYFGILWSLLFALLFSISDYVVSKTNVATVAFFEWFWFAIWCLFLLFFKKGRREIILWLKDTSFNKLYLFMWNNVFDKLWMITTYKAFSLAPNPAFVSVVWWVQSFIILIFTIVLSIFFPKIILEERKKEVIIQKSIWIIIMFIWIYILYLK